jgi:hypothetical protein
LPLAACETRTSALRRLRQVTLGEVELALAQDSRRWALEFAALEQLLALCQFEEGALDARIRALPDQAFARAAFRLYVLGWVNNTEEE